MANQTDSRKKILIIDDDPNTQRFISVLLDENGYETVTAGDGSEGLERIKQALAVRGLA